MSRRAADAAKAYYDEAVAGADTYWGPWLERAEKVRVEVAGFIGGSARGVAFLQNASLGLNVVARLFDEPVEVLALDKEFPSCTTPWIRAGHRVRFIETPDDGAVHADDVIRATTRETKAFVLSSVQFANGYRADLKAIGDACRERGLVFVVDATQSICAYPIDATQCSIDALVFSGYKWATAGYGIAVLHLSEELLQRRPPLVGWRSARTPYLLENDRLDIAASGVAHELGHPTFPAIFCMGEAVRLFEEVGVKSVSTRIDDLANDLRQRVENLGYRIVSTAEPGASSGILLIESENADELAGELRNRDVWTTARRGGLRVSVHAYNDESDLEAFAEALAALSFPRRRP